MKKQNSGKEIRDFSNHVQIRKSEICIIFSSSQFYIVVSLPFKK